MDSAAFASSCRALGLELSLAQIEAFAAFEEALYRTNELMNLTRVPREECWLRHFVDSLLVHDLIPPKARVLDIGSGPGFPAWPLACARPDLHVTALDSAGKMTGFLKLHLLPNLRVVTDRAEEWGVRDQFKVVTGRAVAPLAEQLEVSAAPCLIEGLVLPLRTPSDLPALENVGASKLGLELTDVQQRTLPTTDTVRLIPVYRKASATPARYPRRWSEMKRSPLSGP